MGVVVGVAALVVATPAPTSAGTASTCARTAYVTNQFSDSVSTIDTATRTKQNPDITVGNLPVGVAITPCALLDVDVTDGRSVEVTGAQFAPVSTVTLTIASEPTTLGTAATAPDGTFDATFEIPCTIPPATTPSPPPPRAASAPPPL